MGGRIAATDLVLLHPRPGVEVDAAEVRARASEGATVIAIDVPAWDPDRGLRKDDFVDYHHQAGVDLGRVGRELELRDVVLSKLPDGTQCAARIALVYVWNRPDSFYDLDAVRIPWEQVAGPRDKRNNPHGKNPTNVWAFAAGKASEGSARSPTTSAGIHLDAVARLVRCHCQPDGVVHVWASDGDAELIERAARSADRRTQRLRAGVGDPRQRRTIETSVTPVSTDAAGETIERVRPGHPRPVRATARFVDCRTGLADLPVGSVTHAVTSPPYNIGYDPFNVETRDVRTGRMTSPDRSRYGDSLPPDVYAGLLESVFRSLDQAAAPNGFELFLDVKNNYQKGRCVPPFHLLALMPARWRLLDLLVWRYDISFDPARKKYKPVYEWVMRVGFGDAIVLPDRPLDDWYVPILKGNSRERRELAHPAMFPREIVTRALEASARSPRLVVDPFLGSGTTIAACLEASVDSIGFEISSAYVGDVEKRLDWVEAGGHRPAITPHRVHPQDSG